MTSGESYHFGLNHPMTLGESYDFGLNHPLRIESYDFLSPLTPHRICCVRSAMVSDSAITLTYIAELYSALDIICVKILPRIQDLLNIILILHGLENL